MISFYGLIVAVYFLILRLFRNDGSSHVMHFMGYGISSKREFFKSCF